MSETLTPAHAPNRPAMQLPCVREVLANIICYSSNVPQDGGTFRSSLPALLCTCREFQSAWLHLGIGQMRHTRDGVVLEGRVDLGALRIYLTFMEEGGDAFNSVVFSNIALARVCKLFPIQLTPLFEARADEFFFPTERFQQFRNDSVRDISSWGWEALGSTYWLTLTLRKHRGHVWANFGADRTNGLNYAVRFNIMLIGRAAQVELSGLDMRRGVARGRSVRLSSQVLDVVAAPTGPLRVPAIYVAGSARWMGHPGLCDMTPADRLAGMVALTSRGAVPGGSGGARGGAATGDD